MSLLLKLKQLEDGQVTDSSVPLSDTGTLNTLISNLANRIKAITGEADWKSNPDISLSTLYARTITPGTGLTGGGSLATNLVLSLDTAYTDGRYIQNQNASAIVSNYHINGIGQYYKPVPGNAIRIYSTVEAEETTMVLIGVEEGTSDHVGYVDIKNSGGATNVKLHGSGSGIYAPNLDSSSTYTHVAVWDSSSKSINAQDFSNFLFDIINGISTDFYTKTEIDSFFSGVTGITGYNKTNWDIAFSWGNHASAGYLLSSSYTAADVLTKIKTVDGPGSGLDADLLDGYDSSMSATGSTVAVRNASGYLSAVYYADTNTDVLTTTNTITSMYASKNDGYLYKWDAAAVKVFLGLTSAITGSGTSGYIPLFSGGTTLGNSLLFQSASTIIGGSISAGANIRVVAHDYGNTGLFEAYGTDNQLKFQVGAVGNGLVNIYGHTGVSLRFYSNEILRMIIKDDGSIVTHGASATGEAFIIGGSTRVNNYLRIASGSPYLELLDTTNGIIHYVEGTDTSLVLYADFGNTQAGSAIDFKVDGNTTRMSLSATQLITFGAANTTEAHIFGGSTRVNGEFKVFGNSRIIDSVNTFALAVGGSSANPSVVALGTTGTAVPMINGYTNASVATALSLQPNGGNLLVGTSTDNSLGLLQVAGDSYLNGNVSIGGELRFHATYSYSAGETFIGKDSSNAIVMVSGSTGNTHAFANATGQSILELYNSRDAIFYGNVRALNFSDSTGTYNVNLGSGGSEGRGLVAGYSGGAYGGIGYNVRHTTTGGQYYAPLGDTSNYLVFSQGFTFYGDASTTPGRTISYTVLATLTNAGDLTVNNNITATSGRIVSGSGSVNGFYNAIYVSGFNNIWAFANADTYGIGYKQGATGWYSSDTIRFDVSGDLKTIASPADFEVGPNIAWVNGNVIWHQGNDGATSGLDADLLDGQHGSYYQAALGGTGIVKSTAGTISYLTDNTANWDTAYGWGDHSVAGYVNGSGTDGRIPKFSGSSNTLGDSLLYQNANTIVGDGANLRLESASYGNTGILELYGISSNLLVQLGNSTSTEAYLLANTGVDFLFYFGGTPIMRGVAATANLVLGSTNTDDGNRLQVVGSASFTGRVKTQSGIGVSFDSGVDSVIAYYSTGIMHFQNLSGSFRFRTSLNTNALSLDNDGYLYLTTPVNSAGTYTLLTLNSSTNIVEKIASTTFALASHTHTTADITNLSSYTGLDTRYHTKTEINNFFSGTTAITGYNKSNWDTAHGWGDHANLYEDKHNYDYTEYESTATNAAGSVYASFFKETGNVSRYVVPDLALGEQYTIKISGIGVNQTGIGLSMILINPVDADNEDLSSAVHLIATHSSPNSSTSTQHTGSIHGETHWEMLVTFHNAKVGAYGIYLDCKLTFNDVHPTPYSSQVYTRIFIPDDIATALANGEISIAPLALGGQIVGGGSFNDVQAGDYIVKIVETY